MLWLFFGPAPSTQSDLPTATPLPLAAATGEGDGVAAAAILVGSITRFFTFVGSILQAFNYWKLASVAMARPQRTFGVPTNCNTGTDVVMLIIATTACPDLCDFSSQMG